MKEKLTLDFNICSLLSSVSMLLDYVPVSDLLTQESEW